MRMLTHQTIKSNFHNFYARTLFHAVSKPLPCDIKPATTEQHLLITRSTEYRKIQQNGLNELQQKMLIYLWHESGDFSYIPKRCEFYMEEEFYWKTSLVVFCRYTDLRDARRNVHGCSTDLLSQSSSLLISSSRQNVRKIMYSNLSNNTTVCQKLANSCPLTLC